MSIKYHVEGLLFGTGNDDQEGRKELHHGRHYSPQAKSKKNGGSLRRHKNKAPLKMWLIQSINRLGTEHAYSVEAGENSGWWK